jgi:hypothetical protein
MRGVPLPLSTAALPAVGVAFALVAPAAAAAQDYYTDVRPALVESCMGCHTQEGIGWSMEDAEATYDEHRKIARAVTSEMMPPWLAEPGHQEYLDDLSLDADVIAMVAAWQDAGYPKGEARPDPVRHAGMFAEFSPDVSSDILPGQSYLPAQTMDDEYRCFAVDWEATEPTYVTGFRAVPGNANVAHHVVVEVVDPGMFDRFKEIDDETEGAGWECFGGPLPTSFDWDEYETRYEDGRRELSNSTWWLTHWAPGMYGNRFPEDTGILIRPGSGLVVQMHYYTKEARGEADAGTLVEFETAPAVEKPAFMLVQTRNDWLYGEDNGSMVIPAGETATYSLADQLGDYVGYAASLADVDAERVQGFEIYSANLHMHAFGASGDISLTDPNGRTETLLAVPEWNLHWQRDFAFAEPKVFDREALDDTTLRLRCTYRNDTDQTVYGGYGSFDEMCFNMSYVAVELGERATDLTGSRQR